MLRFLLCGVERGFPEDFSSGFHGGKAGQGWWMGDDNLSGGTDDTALWSTSMGPSTTKHNQSFIWDFKKKMKLDITSQLQRGAMPDYPICNSATPVSVLHLHSLKYVHIVACQCRKVVENGQSTCSFGTVLGSFRPFWTLSGHIWFETQERFCQEALNVFTHIIQVSPSSTDKGI